MKSKNSINGKSAVQQMREIRDKISNDIKDMTFEEERAYLDQMLMLKRSGIFVKGHHLTIANS